MSRNRVEVIEEDIDLSKIKKVNDVDIDKVEKIEIKGSGYKGILLIVHDPSKVFVGIGDIEKGKGKFLKDMVKKYDAFAGINAGGFVDMDSKHGDGRLPDGLLISEGKVLNGVDGVKYGLIGFNTDDKLMLGSYTLSQIKKMRIRDAVSFFPPLIINGEPAKIIGNGGWGVNPRTAIGQREDGAVLLLIIDGRQASSVGTTINEVQKIMLGYDAVNATNLDGGSSTIMVYENEIVNSPSSVNTGRFLPNGFIVKR